MSKNSKVNIACFCERAEIEPTSDALFFVALNGVDRDGLEYLKQTIAAEESRLRYLEEWNVKPD